MGILKEFIHTKYCEKFQYKCTKNHPYSPPGTGKTLLAKSLVKDMTTQLEGTNISFFYHKGCESFSQYFGESEENLRALFKKAKENKPYLDILP